MSAAAVFYETTRCRVSREILVAAAAGLARLVVSPPPTTRVARRRTRVGAIVGPVRAMSTAWPPPVGARVRPVETAAETVSPDGDPVPAPGAGPMWARLRYAPPSAGDDRREGMVADVCDDDAHAPTASVVWEDGAEEDGVPLARLGPVVDARPDDDPKTAATNARERGNARFRAGDHAAAAAEYVEACAWLLRAIPTGARAIPGRAEDWRVPGVVDWRAPDADPGPTDDGRVSTAPFRPTVGARVRVLGADGASRSGMVSYIESDEELCDVMFDDDDGGGGGDDEEVGVPFHRLFGVAEPITDRSNDPASIGDDDAAIEERLRRRSAAEASAAEADRVVATLAECLLNVARCHLKLSDTKSGGSVAAHACVDAASAALSVRRSAAAFYLRGRAKTVTCRFRSAGEDLRAALSSRARRRRRRRRGGRRSGGTRGGETSRRTGSVRRRGRRRRGRRNDAGRTHRRFARARGNEVAV